MYSMQKKFIRLNLQQHRNVERIFATYEYDDSINKIIKQIPGAKYSASRKSWHFPAVKELVKLFAERVKNIAILDLTELRKQLLAKKQLPAVLEKHGKKP